MGWCTGEKENKREKNHVGLSAQNVTTPPPHTHTHTLPGTYYTRSVYRSYSLQTLTRRPPRTRTPTREGEGESVVGTLNVDEHDG